MSVPMKIFLTGSTGYIGSAVLEALLRAGQQVTALVRDPGRAEQMANRGMECVLGELTTPRTYAVAADGCDVVVHTAFERSKRGQKVDRQAIDTFLEVATRRRTRGQSSAVVYTSGVWVLGPTQGQ